MQLSDYQLSAIKNGLDDLTAAWEKKYSSDNDNVPAWILPPRSCAFLQAVAGLFPEGANAFEFGSGCSTHALRAACKKVVSIEDSQDWLTKTEDNATGIKKRSSDITYVIPLTKCWGQGRPFNSFDLESHPEAIEHLRTSHIILIDSPPNPATREDALLKALKYCSPGAIIIVDDLDFHTTRRFTHRIARQNSCTLDFWHLNFDHHLGVFFKRRSSKQSIHSFPTLREIAGQWLRYRKVK